MWAMPRLLDFGMGHKPRAAAAHTYPIDDLPDLAAAPGTRRGISAVGSPRDMPQRCHEWPNDTRLTRHLSPVANGGGSVKGAGLPGEPRGSRLGGRGLQRPRHQLLHDLGGAGVDAVHAGVGVGARDRVFQHVAVAAEELQAGVEHLVVELGQPPLAHGRRGGVELACQEQLQAVVEEHARHRHLGLHLGQLEARVLEIGDRLAEGLALARVVDGPSQRRLHDGDGADGHQQALARQLVHQAGEAAALLAQDIGGRNAHVLEEQLGGVLRVLADLLEVAPALEAGPVGLHQHQRHALGAGRRVGLGGDDDEIGQPAVGDEGLLAVHHQLVALAQRRGADRLQVAARAGLGHGDGGDHLALGHLRQPGALLLLAAVVEDVGRDDVGVQAEAGRREHALGHLLDHDRAVEEIGAAAAVFLGHVGEQQARRRPPSATPRG